MHVKISTGSAKAFYLDKEKLLRELRRLSEELTQSYSFVKEVHLFGSLVRGDHRGISDADIVVVVSEDLNRKNFWKIYRQTFDFFADRLPVNFDLIVVDTERKEQVLEKLKPALLLGRG
ncbi:MAG: nucleotidyltransferase domain-containing protein [Aquificaceae bacterium]